jgi:IS1 family transposase
MHEAEAKVLNHQQWWAYQEQLEKLVKYTLGATASQRAEAFLRTLNLWKD